MSDYIRPRVPGASVFFTVALADRVAGTLVAHVDALRDAVSVTCAERPFRIDAWVVLPDHMHAVWTLPEADADYSGRWKEIKTRFTKSLGCVGPRSASKIAKGEAGIWQRRFWEHHIRDERDYTTHLRYCWWNPVKHGFVERAVEWPYSSIHRDIRAGQSHRVRDFTHHGLQERIDLLEQTEHCRPCDVETKSQALRWRRGRVVREVTHPTLARL